MKRTLITMAAAAAVCLGAQASDKPAIEFNTSIYSNIGPTNSFTIYIGTTEDTYMDVDCGYGTFEAEVKPATWNDETQSINATAIPCQVTSDGNVKIYCDKPEIIDYLSIDGAYITDIDLGDCTNLVILSLQHNDLQRLDLTKYTNLQAIYLSDNPYTPETPLVVGDNKPNLSILEVDITNYISPDFDINTYPSLVSFDAYACYSLSKITPAGCPELRRLSLDMTAVSSVDLSQNSKLQILNIEDSRITSIDLSGCPNLTQLYARNMSGWVNTDCKIESIDLSHNTELTYVTLNGNLLKDIDLSKNTKLSFVNVADNLLTTIDVSTLSELYSLDISGNNMSFATMPMPDSYWGDYSYSQRPIALNRSYPVGTELDFSDKVLRENTETDAVLYGYSVASNSTTVIDPSYYEYKDGKVTLLKEYSDSLFISFGNTGFPDANMTTSKFMVKTADNFNKPNNVLSFTSGVSTGQTFPMYIGIDGATPSSPKKFYIDLGDGNLQEFSATSASMPATPNVNGTRAGYGTVIIYTEGDDVLTAVGIDNAVLYSINATKATELRELRLTGTELYNIDLSYNRCLKSLKLTGNHFSTLSLAGVNGNYSKNVLSDIDLSDNGLTDVELNAHLAIRRLILDNNKLTTFNASDFDNIQEFSIKNNKLTDLSIVYMEQASRVDISNNNIGDLRLPENNVFDYLNLSGNEFTMETVPAVKLKAGAEYIYAPQADLQIATRGPGINLSAQNRVINGQGTSYTWKKEDGTTLTEGVDYTISNGITSFINTTVGKIRCEMTNPAFPGFTGNNVFKTTLIEAAGMPTHELASFVTTNDGETPRLSLAAKTNGTTIYFDWDGEGKALEQYILGTTYRLFDGYTRAGANVKVYTYEPTDIITVFSINGATMDSFDGSKLTDVSTLSVNGANLPEITLPATNTLKELFLTENNLTDIDLSAYPGLVAVSLNDNALTSIDLSGNSKLQVANLSNNNITSIKTGNNNNLWFLAAAENQLEEIDLSGVPGLEQLGLSGNKLTGIDVSGLSRLRQLNIDRNYFTFTTLPEIKSNYVSYVYGNQAALDVTCEDGKVDLSSQAAVQGTDTEYRWFLGVPEFDETGTLVGEELYVNDEYYLDNGVTTFTTALSNVMCVMTNSLFPDLYLYTNLLDVNAGVNDVRADSNDFNVSVRNRDIIVKADVKDNTPVTLYSIDGRVVALGATANGTATLHCNGAGTYVIAVAGHAAKVNVR